MARKGKDNELPHRRERHLLSRLTRSCHGSPSVTLSSISGSSIRLLLPCPSIPSNCNQQLREGVVRRGVQLARVIPPADLRELRASGKLAGKLTCRPSRVKTSSQRGLPNAASFGFARMTSTRNRRYSSRDISLLPFCSARSSAMRSLTPACFIQSFAHTSLFLLLLPATRR